MLDAYIAVDLIVVMFSVGDALLKWNEEYGNTVNVDLGTSTSVGTLVEPLVYIADG